MICGLAMPDRTLLILVRLFYTAVFTFFALYGGLHIVGVLLVGIYAVAHVI